MNMSLSPFGYLIAKKLGLFLNSFCVFLKDCLKKKHIFQQIMKCIHKFPNLKNTCSQFTTAFFKNESFQELRILSDVMKATENNKKNNSECKESKICVFHK